MLRVTALANIASYFQTKPRREPVIFDISAMLYLQNFLSGILTDQALVKRRAQTLMFFCIQ